MTTTVSEYIDVRGKLRDLGCLDPHGFSLLPVNFESATSIAEFRQVSEAATVKTLLRLANLPQSEIVAQEQRPPYIQNNALEWIVPTLFITAGLVSEHPEMVSVALSVIANYAADFFKGLGGEKSIKLDIVVERSSSKRSRKISYQGSPDGLKDLAAIIEAAKDE
jgi:hypothetical protein